MKLICITGGVLSGIGKGISGASLGTLLSSCGYKIFMQKFDGYLNQDAGLIDPLKHGECFVTSDGAQTDLDIGHYERFLDTPMSRESSYSMGTIYQEIFHKEQCGDYQGHDIQVVPHVTNLIKEKIRQGYEHSQADISIIEVGGTIGDIENEVIVEALRELQHELGREDVIFVHVSYIPFILASQELKTKPTQSSIKDLRARGIVPNLLFLRSDYEIPSSIRHKVSMMCGVDFDLTIPVPTLQSIYQVPALFNTFDLAQKISSLLHLESRAPNIQARNGLSDSISQSLKTLEIAILGSYGNFEEAYYSLKQALILAGRSHHHHLKLHFVSAQEITSQRMEDHYDHIQAWCCAGDERTHDIPEGLIKKIIDDQTPLLGISAGAQALVKALLPSDISLPHGPMFAPHLSKDGSKSVMKLGDHQCILQTNNNIAHLYEAANSSPKSQMVITERYRQREKLSDSYTPLLEQYGFKVVAKSSEDESIQMLELQDHPFFCLSFARPDLQTRPTQLHPLFKGFIQAIVAKLS